MAILSNQRADQEIGGFQAPASRLSRPVPQEFLVAFSWFSGRVCVFNPQVKLLAGDLRTARLEGDEGLSS